VYSKTAVESSRLLGQLRRWISFFFSVAKKLSATAVVIGVTLRSRRDRDAGVTRRLAEAERDVLGMAGPRSSVHLL
jgi:hypothetical protein